MKNNQVNKEEYIYCPTNPNLQAQLNFTKFWKDEVKQSPFLIQSPLVNLKKNNNVNYALNKEGQFIKTQRGKQKASNLLSNLYLLSEGQKSFILQSQFITKEYHISDENLLKEWLTKLSQFCIVIGKINQKYIFVKQMNNGKFSKGFLIQDQKSKQQYICKTFQKRDVTRVEKLRDSIIGEILLLRQFDSPQIMKLHEVHQDSLQIYMVFEYVKSELYQQFMRRKKDRISYSEYEVSQLMIQVLKGLEYIHSMNIIHRDIKLENLVYKENGSLMIADFGLSAQLTDNFQFKKYGTPGYIAPEVLNLNSYNEKVDIFSAGVVAYILLTQNPVFVGTTLTAILTANTAGRVDYKSPKFTCLSEDCREFLKKLLCLQENDRPSATQCLKLGFLNIKPNQFDQKKSDYANNQDITLSYLASSVMPESINLKKAKRKSMRQYIILKQAINTHSIQQQQQQLEQYEKEINNQQKQKEQISDNNEVLTVTESVHNILNSFYVRPKRVESDSEKISIEMEEEEDLDGQSSSEDSDLFMDDDDESTINLGQKLQMLQGFIVKSKGKHKGENEKVKK